MFSEIVPMSMTNNKQKRLTHIVHNGNKEKQEIQ